MGLISNANTIVDIRWLNIEPSTLKKMDLAHALKLKTSIEHNGQLRNILVDSSLNVLEGRRIASIMRELGHEYIEVKYCDPENVLAQLALDSEYSSFDFINVSLKLAEHFDLNNKSALYARLPFDNDHIEDYVESVAFTMDQFNAHKSERQASLFAIEAPIIEDPADDNLFGPLPVSKMRALSWKEPFGSLMLYGKIETRKWNTGHRGPVLICVSQTGYNIEDLKALSGETQIKRIIETLGALPDTKKGKYGGQAIAIADLVKVYPMRPEDEDACFVKYADNLFCHVYENVRRIKPIPFKGGQGWKNLDENFINSLEIIQD